MNIAFPTREETCNDPENAVYFGDPDDNDRFRGARADYAVQSRDPGHAAESQSQ
jgi:hypothetical protein